ncbi:MAG: hypothetical protein IT410_01100 [Candidatus Doudnabacteria bacterium]|nr:hypothetical protein [Candidatus Doudnabacteria bacterium]
MLSTQSKSFFLVLFIAVVSIYSALLLTRELGPIIVQKTGLNPSLSNNTTYAQTNVPLSTKDWNQYEDSKYPLDFKYPKEWTVTTYSATDPNIGYIIILKPDNDKADNIRIYINAKGYVATSGLTTTKTTINGINGITVNDMLVGIRQGNNYITFDLGTSPELLPYFKALLSTVEITK